jgi:DNA-binding response OmpR family regulator
MRILVVEDDDHVAGALESALRQRGYHVVCAASGAQALAACRQGPPLDLVLLDLGLPDSTGLQLSVTLRGASGAPVVIVTADGEIRSRVEALRLGADDYIVKPFNRAELLARVEAVLRRCRRVAEPETVEVGDVHMDLRARNVTVAGRSVALTRMEFGLLAMLVRNRGSVVERQRILVQVWGTDWLGTSRTLEVHVATVRRKLGRPWIIETARGVGYRLGTSPQS